MEEEFVQPKSNEKRDKKSRKAEERRRQKEAKRLLEEGEQQRYIPGMQPQPGRNQQEATEGRAKEQQREALKKLQVSLCILLKNFSL